VALLRNINAGGRSAAWRQLRRASSQRLALAALKISGAHHRAAACRWRRSGGGGNIASAWHRGNGSKSGAARLSWRHGACSPENKGLQPAAATHSLCVAARIGAYKAYAATAQINIS